MRPYLVLLLLLAGCALKARKEVPTVMNAAGVQMPADRIRIDAYEASRRFSGGIEAAAEAIQDSTNDAEMWRRAQDWKINGTQAAQDAAFRFDPLVSFLDLYALAEQQRNYLTVGRGKDVFGPWQHVATEAADEIHANIRSYIEGIVPPEKYRFLDSVDAWAARHPIEQSAMTRPSIESVSARLIDADETSVFSALGDIQQSARSINGRVALVQQNLTKQLRWQVELMAAEMLPMSSRDSLVHGVGTIAAAVDRLATTTEGLPGLIEEQRVATFEEIAGERMAVLAAIAGEREMVMNQVTAERMAILEAVDQQRRFATADMEQVAARLTAAAMEQMTSFADHLIWRVALVIVLPILLGIGILIIALAFILRPRGVSG